MTRALLASGVAAVTLLAGCGGEDEPPAQRWAGDVCSSIADWRTAVAETTESLTAGATTEEDFRAAADELEEASRDLVESLRDLGPPDTEAGDEADAAVDELADSVDQNIEAARSAVEGVTGISDILEAASVVTTALAGLQEELSATVEELQELDPAGELESGFQEADSCDELRDGG